MFYKIFWCLLTYTFFFTNGFLNASQFSDQSEIEDVYRTALTQSPFLLQIHNDGLERRQQEQLCLERVREKINETGLIDEDFYEKVMRFLKKEHENLSQLDALIKPYGIGQDGTTWQLKTNKMVFGLNKTLTFLEDPKNFFDLIEGNPVDGFDLTAPTINYTEEPHIFSSSRGLIMKFTLISSWLISRENPSLKSIERATLCDLENIPFIHRTPLPRKLQTSDIQSIFINDNSLAVIHNGYTFGGHRDEEDTSDNYPPEDCSSFVAKYAGCEPFSTYHQALHYQNQLGFMFENLGNHIVEKWEEANANWKDDTTFRPSMLVSLESFVTPSDPKRIPVGCIHGERGYKGISIAPEKAVFGAGGHTTFYLGTIGSGPDIQAITLGTNRGYPEDDRDGTYVVERRPLYTDPIIDEKMVMLFNIKN